MKPRERTRSNPIVDFGFNRTVRSRYIAGTRPGAIIGDRITSRDVDDFLPALPTLLGLFVSRPDVNQSARSTLTGGTHPVKVSRDR